MQTWAQLLLPGVLILARTAAFFATLPVFSSRSIPRQAKVGLAVMMTIFFAGLLPAPALAAGPVRMLPAGLLVAREVLCGLALGLAVRLVFTAIQQGGSLIGRQMGFAMASIIDPSSGERTQPFGMYLETLFTLLFLVSGGHHLLVRLIGRSYQVLPVGGSVDFGALASGVLAAGSAMLLLALKLAAPLLAAFLVLSVVLAVLARLLPQMNILLTSLPLRVGVGLLLAVAIIPLLQSFVDEIAGWMNQLL